MNVEQQTERFVFQFDDGQFLHFNGGPMSIGPLKGAVRFVGPYPGLEEKRQMQELMRVKDFSYLPGEFIPVANFLPWQQLKFPWG